MEILKWDGTFLGRFSNKVVIKKSQSVRIGNKQLSVWYFNQPIVFKGFVIPTLNVFPCISDSLKSLFDLKSNGTHTMTINSKLYLLIKYKSYLRYYIILSEIKDISLMDENYKKEIRKLIAYRELICSYPNTYDTILIDENFKYKPISIFENMNRSLQAIKSSGCLFLSLKVQSDLFNTKNTLYNTIYALCIEYFTDKQKLSHTTNTIRVSIFNLIKKIDHDSIHLVGVVYERLCNFLLLSDREND